MPKQNKKRARITETDSSYLLKLVIYVVLGSLWLKFQSPLTVGDIVVNGLPVGLVLGLAFASRDRFQTDRKIEYAVLVIVAVLSYFAPSGIVV